MINSFTFVPGTFLFSLKSSGNCCGNNKFTHFPARSSVHIMTIVSLERAEKRAEKLYYYHRELVIGCRNRVHISHLNVVLSQGISTELLLQYIHPRSISFLHFTAATYFLTARHHTTRFNATRSIYHIWR